MEMRVPFRNIEEEGTDGLCFTQLVPKGQIGRR